MRFPNESAEYRAARTALLVEEIELRRQMERVAALRRALPPGGLVTGDYRFQGEDGAETDLAGLFGDKQTLAAYSYMFGPQRERPCPMCTNLLDAWDGNAADIGQRLSLVVIARSPIEKLVGLEARAWLEGPAALHRPDRRLFARLFRAGAERFGRPVLQCFHPARRDDPALLVERDEQRRSRPGCARRPGHLCAALEHAGHRAGRAAGGLVSEPGVLNRVESRRREEKAKAAPSPRCG
jgi:hypothetical protein